MQYSKALDRLMSTMGDLPALPAVVSEVMTMTDDPSIGMDRISAQIERDPALTAKILRISNSPYYGMRQYIGTLKLALVVLGVREVRNIVLGVSVFYALQDDTHNSPLRHAFWGHATNVAALSKRLARQFVHGLDGEDFISGLLHDVGKMALWRKHGEDYAAILTGPDGNGPRLCETETRSFGYDHAEMAAALAVNWNLPKTLVDALYCHHAGEGRVIAEARDPRLAALVRIANAAVYEDFFAQEQDLPFPSCEDEEAWGVLAAHGAPAEPSERRRLLKTLLTEMAESIG